MAIQMYLTGICKSANEGRTRVFRDFSNPTLNTARAFIYRVVQSYWDSVCRNHTDSPLPLPALPKSLAADLPRTAVDGAAVSNFVKGLPADYSLQAAFELTGKYAALLPPGVRRNYGIFYTPPSLTDRLLSIAATQGLDWRTCTVLDPACGGGAFLAPVAMLKRQVLQGLPSTDRVQAISGTLKGFEIDPYASWLSQVLTELALIEDVIESGNRLADIVQTCDALRCAPPHASFDLVVGNPPYGRASLSKEDRDIYQRSLYGHANLYGMFTDLALRAAKPGGVIALVTPASYLAGQYFKNLRKTIREEASPRQIDFVEKRAGTFDGVLQETGTFMAMSRAVRP